MVQYLVELRNRVGDFMIYADAENAQGILDCRNAGFESVPVPFNKFKDEGIEEREGKTVYSFCAIDSKEGRQGVYGDKIHQDCSQCTVPHHVSYVRKHFDTEWKKIMKACRL